MDYPLTDALITFNLYDQNGAVVGGILAHVQHLPPGGRWRFAAPSPVAFARVQVSKVQVFPPAAPAR